MSDYLTNLIARTLNPAAIVPRLPSQFEPAPAQSGWQPSALDEAPVATPPEADGTSAAPRTFRAATHSPSEPLALSPMPPDEEPPGAPEHTQASIRRIARSGQTDPVADHTSRPSAAGRVVRAATAAIPGADPEHLSLPATHSTTVDAGPDSGSVLQRVTAGHPHSFGFPIQQPTVAAPPRTCSTEGEQRAADDAAPAADAPHTHEDQGQLAGSDQAGTRQALSSPLPGFASINEPVTQIIESSRVASAGSLVVRTRLVGSMLKAIPDTQATGREEGPGRLTAHPLNAGTADQAAPVPTNEERTVSIRWTSEPASGHLGAPSLQETAHVLSAGTPPRPIPAGAPTSVSTPEPAPTIQVTIGRVEVRATTPSAPAPRQREGPSQSSLDAYLRKRNGGGS